MLMLWAFDGLITYNIPEQKKELTIYVLIIGEKYSYTHINLYIKEEYLTSILQVYIVTLKMADILDLKQPHGPCHTNYSKYGTIMPGLTGHISQGPQNDGVLIIFLNNSV